MTRGLISLAPRGSTLLVLAFTGLGVPGGAVDGSGKVFPGFQTRWGPSRVRWWRQVALACAIGVPLAGIPSADAFAAPPVVGTLTQLPGPAGCISSNGASSKGAGTCTTASEGVLEPESATVSPDGNNVYVGDYSRGETRTTPKIEVFSRNVATSALTQLTGAAGCLAEIATPCSEARAQGGFVGDGRDIAITPDGMWTYVAVQRKSGDRGGAVLIFRRNPATGILTQLPGNAGCITSDGSSQAGAATCQTDATLSTPMGVSLSPDDAFLYVADYGFPNRIHVFARNGATGELTDVQCISEAPAPASCSTGRVLGQSQSIAITPNGLHAYSANYSNGISVFDRNPATGLLTQQNRAAGCVTDEGKDDTGAATCTRGRVLSGAYPLTISANGETLYVPAHEDHGIAIFRINADGALTQLAGASGCITETGTDNEGNATCTAGRDVEHIYGAQLSPDGRTFYTTSNSIENGIAAFAVNPSTGQLTQLAGTAGCTTVKGEANGAVATAGQCAEGRTLSGAYELGISPDGTSVYVASDEEGNNNGGIAVFTRQAAPTCAPTSGATKAGTAVTISLPCSSPNGDPLTISITSATAHGTLSAVNQASETVTYTPTAGYSGPDSFGYQASDGTNTSAAAVGTVTVSPPPPPSNVMVSPSTASAVARTLTLLGRVRAGAKGVTFTVSCQAPARESCDAEGAIVSVEHLTGKRLVGISVSRRRHARTKNVTVGDKSFTVPAGKTETVFVPLNSLGNKLLKRFHRLPVKLTITLTNGAGGRPSVVATQKLVIKPAKNHKRSHHK